MIPMILSHPHPEIFIGIHEDLYVLRVAVWRHLWPLVGEKWDKEGSGLHNWFVPPAFLHLLSSTSCLFQTKERWSGKDTLLCNCSTSKKLDNQWEMKSSSDVPMIMMRMTIALIPLLMMVGWGAFQLLECQMIWWVWRFDTPLCFCSYSKSCE